MRLYVNIDHVATLREARKTDEPDPVRAAEAAERGGADGITVHLREDRRHIQDADVRALRERAHTVLNLELGASAEILRLACRLRPFQATLVPERRTIERAAALGVAAIELHTGRYAHTWSRSEAALAALRRAAREARALGLAVHAGHGLTYQNVQPVAAIPEIEELNIGHSIVSNAVYWGLEEAVRRMRKLVDEAPSTVGRRHNPSRDC